MHTNINTFIVDGGPTEKSFRFVRPARALDVVSLGATQIPLDSVSIFRSLGLAWTPSVALTLI